MKVLSKVLLICAISLSLSACSTFSFLFERLPFLTTWQMDRMFDLSDEQEELVHSSTEELVIWLRSEGLPQVIEDLENSRTLWQNHDYEAAATHFEHSLEEATGRFLNAVRPHLVTLFLSFDETNAHAYREYNNDRKIEWFESLESEQAKEDKVIDRLEQWFGSLDKQQLRTSREIISLVDNERDIRLANNELWKERFLSAALAQDKQALDTWLSQPELWWSEEYRQLREVNSSQRRTLVRAMIESMKPEQSEQVVETIEDWIDSLNSVI